MYLIIKKKLSVLFLLKCFCTGFLLNCAHASSLAELDLEDLMAMGVTTVSKRVQPLFSAAAAIYVITNEEIYRSGATSVPEALRMAPGVEVSRVNSSTWAVSIRGLNSMYSQNLLVLVDGRSVYTPFYGGVYWDLVMPSLEDIDRIEVIRGPGASLWGVNAVNGVVNVITKSAEITQGYRAAFSLGNEEKHLRVRAGDRTGNFFYRGYAVHRDIDSGKEEGSSRSARDAYQGVQIGGRADLILGDKKLTLQGDYSLVDRSYNPAISDQNSEARSDFENGSWNVLSRWLQPLGSDSLQLQIYADQIEREEPGYEYSINSYDFDLQYNVARINDHQLTWGLNYRYFDDKLDGADVLQLQKDTLTWEMYSAFLQGDWQINESLS